MFKFNSLDNEDDSSYNPPKVAFNFQHYTKKKTFKKKKLCLISYYALQLHMLTHLPAAVTY